MNNEFRFDHVIDEKLNIDYGYLLLLNNLLCSRPYRKWGFHTKEGQMMRPLRYFHKFGIPPCDCQ